MAFRVSPGQTAVCLLESAGKIIGLLQPLYLAWFAEGALRHDTRQMVLAVIAFTASIGLTWIFQLAGTTARVGQMERVGFAFDTEIARITASIKTLDHLESPHYLDRLQILRDRQEALGGAFNIALNTFNNLLAVVGTLLLALTADPRLLLLALAGLPMLATTRWVSRWQAAAEQASAQPGRLAKHLLELGTSPSSGAELRVFGIRATMRRELSAAVADWRGPGARLAVRTNLLEGACATFFYLTASAILAWMVSDALSRTLPMGALVVAVMLVGRLQTAGQTVQWAIISFTQIARITGSFLWLREYEHQVRTVHRGTREPPPQLGDGIRLEHLTFSYPGGAAPAIRDVSLHLPAGSVVAFVGENGAGKTTLVKLLTGMYQPTSGRILLDNTDLVDIDIDAWRASTAGAFQDYAKLELTAQQTVGVGDVPRLDDRQAVLDALGIAGSEDVLHTLPQGLDTQLGSSWPAGVDLSGGQWQRLAIARGMMRPEPLLLVLDEPTAALDASTEHRLFERYIAAADGARSRGAITLLITHRFSTVAAADLVVVLDHGTIAEVGTHHQLVAAQGHYSELYALQARGYQ
ncbi:ABC transporter ATP-binding protein [Actinopolymorpha alba]|uniref:ABC transporter ATP-binding protein n=1 Tax=Actinopolymorpha alba TaxID=533267 RepID=UPI001ED9B19A|nr:ABC transporter ATP-binding protein [Actinopolymorpha alba]